MTQQKHARPILGLMTLALSCAGSPAFAAAGSAAWQPTKPIKLIVSYPAGGPVDQMARAFSAELGTELGQPVIVENRGGASGTLGANYVRRAEPDGHTISLILDAHTIVPSLIKEAGYDPLKDFTPIGLVTRAPMAIGVNAQRPYQTFRDVAEAAKAKPKSASYGVSQGTLGSLVMLQLQHLGHFELLNVPYKGAAPALQDALGGQIDMVVGFPSKVMPYIQSKQMRVLAVTTKERSKDLPDVPTLSEQGFGNIDWSGWMGLAGPAGMPGSVVQRYSLALKKVLAEPAVVERFNSAGTPATFSDAPSFAKFMAAETVYWHKVIVDGKLAASSN